MTFYTLYEDSPVGRILLTSDGEALTRLYMGEYPIPPDWQRRDDDPLLAAARRQLADYFGGSRTEFDLPLRPAGTPFQLEVWEALRQIPHGQVLSYGALARRIGKPGAARAVGLANGQNPIAIVVPCHRVIGADGSLTGYGGGLWRKEALLKLEGAVFGRSDRQLSFPLEASR